MAMPNGDGNGKFKAFYNNWNPPHHFDYYAPDFAQKVYYISVEPDFSAVALFATDWAAGRAQPFAKLT